MKKIEVKGTIVSDAQAEFYRWFEIPCTSPASIELPDNGEEVLVEINSGGGEVFAGSEIFTKLKAYDGKVTARVVGLAASAASVILMGADEIEISPTAQIMIHNAWSTTTGDSEKLRHESGVLENINQSIMSTYEMKTGLPKDELRELMSVETWMGAEQAVELGFADRVMFNQEETPLNVYASAGYVLPDEVLTKLDNFMKQSAPLDIKLDLDELADKVAARLQKNEDVEMNKQSSLFLF